MASRLSWDARIRICAASSWTWPRSVRWRTNTFNRGGLAGRFSTSAADMFEGPYPQGADAIVLGHVLHDWSDDTCHRILSNCFLALPPDGALLVVEKVLDENFSSTTATLMKDLTMLIGCESGARERTEAEYRGLLESAGFRMEQVVRLNAPRDLIVAKKP